MISNSTLVLVSTLLSLSWMAIPVVFAKKRAAYRFAGLAMIHAGVFLSAGALWGAKTAFVVIALSLVIALFTKLAKLNYQLVHFQRQVRH